MKREVVSFLFSDLHIGNVVINGRRIAAIDGQVRYFHLHTGITAKNLGGSRN